jgi:hypothetical protein
MLLDEFQNADDLADALPGEILKVTGLVGADHAVENCVDILLGRLRQAYAAHHVGVGLDPLDRAEDRRGGLLGRLDDGIEFAGDAAHAFAGMLGAVEAGDLGLGAGDRFLHQFEFVTHGEGFTEFASAGFHGLARAHLGDAAKVVDGGEDLLDTRARRGLDRLHGRNRGGQAEAVLDAVALGHHRSCRPSGSRRRDTIPRSGFHLLKMAHPLRR